MRNLLVALLFVSTATGADQPVVPVYEEPFHRLAAESSSFRILDVLIPAGETTLFHTHAEPTFYITLQRTSVRAQRPGAEWSAPSVADWAAGDVRLDDKAGVEPFTHRVNNAGNEDFRLILITNDRRAPYVPNVELIKSMPGVPDADGRYFAQSRIEIDAGEVYDWDGVEHPLILVLATDTHVVVRGHRDDIVGRGLYDPGDFDFVNPDAAVRFENRGNEPAIIIAVAIR